MAQRQINLIDAILQAMFPVGTIQAFLIGSTQPAGWQDMPEIEGGYGLVAGSSNVLTEGKIGDHHHSLGGYALLRPTNDWETIDVNKNGNAYPVSFRGASKDNVVKNTTGLTDKVGGNQNLAAGLYVKFKIWDPNNVIVHKYDKRRFYFQMHQCSAHQHLKRKLLNLRIRNEGKLTFPVRTLENKHARSKIWQKAYQNKQTRSH